MRYPLRFLFLLPTLVYGNPALSEEPSVEPILARPMPGQYQLVYHYDKPLRQLSPERLAETPVNRRPRRLERAAGQSDGTLVMEKRFWSDGISTDCWIFPNKILFQVPYQSPEMIYAAETHSRDNPHSMSIAFEELQWVSREHFKKAGEYKGRKVDYYSTSITEFDAATETHRAIKVESWFDQASGFPLAFKNDSTLIEYSVIKKAPGPLTAPEAFKKQLQKP